MTAPAAPSEPEKDRIAGWKIAVFSGLLGLVGAVIGGFFSFLVAVHDTGSQRQQSRDDFVRQQRQNAYSSLSSAMLKFQGSITGCSLSLQVSPVTGQTLNRILADISTAQANAADSLGTVTLLGSTTARKDSNTLLHGVYGTFGDCLKAGRISLAHTSVSPIAVKAFAKLDADSFKFAKDLTRFLNDARQDVTQ